MANIIIRPEWRLQDKEATPQKVYLSRKSFLKKTSASLATGALLACGEKFSQTEKRPGPTKQYNAKFAKGSWPPQKNKKFRSVPGSQISSELLASAYNNYYEFTQKKERVWVLAANFKTQPWSITVGGLTHKARRYDLEDIVRSFPLEERVYRFRCVEAWSMIVPWVGIPLAKVIEFFKPLPSARYVRFVGWKRPEQAPGQRYGSYNWPYYEALRMDEAKNELALFTVGMYGHALTKQNGAPARLIVPWKYGYKSMKGITRIEFLAKRPSTFWNDAAPSEYGFYSNVNPKVPHPRWSQAREQLLGEESKVPTLAYNGYGKFVADMYSGKEF